MVVAGHWPKSTTIGGNKILWRFFVAAFHARNILSGCPGWYYPTLPQDLQPYPEGSDGPGEEVVVNLLISFFQASFRECFVALVRQGPARSDGPDQARAEGGATLLRGTTKWKEVTGGDEDLFFLEFLL